MDTPAATAVVKRFRFWQDVTPAGTVTVDVLVLKDQPEVGVAMYCVPPSASGAKPTEIEKGYMTGDQYLFLEKVVNSASMAMKSVKAKIGSTLDLVGAANDATEHILTRKCVSCGKKFNGLCGSCWRVLRCKTCLGYPCHCEKSASITGTEAPSGDSGESDSTGWGADSSDTDDTSSNPMEPWGCGKRPCCTCDNPTAASTPTKN